MRSGPAQARRSIGPVGRADKSIALADRVAGSGGLPYRVKILKPVLDIVGYSGGCLKCAAMQAGGERRTKNHHNSEACRSRVEQGMMSNESIKQSAVGGEH